MFSGKPVRLWVRAGMLVILQGLFWCSLLSAQNKPDTANVYETGQVTLQVEKPRFSVLSPMPSQTLSGKTLDQLNSYSVADAIRYFSGVQLKDYGGVGGLKTVNVRSLGSAHTAVFYDGVPIGNAQNGQVDLGKFSMENVEEIQLFNGQKSTIFQPARGFFSSNSLYLKSKYPHFNDGRTYSVRASGKAGSFGLFNTSALYQQKLSNALALSVNAEWSKADGKYKYRYKKEGGYDTTAVRQNGDIESVRLEAAVFGKIANGSWHIKGYYYDSERGLPGAIVANRYSHYQRQWDQNAFLHGAFQKAWNDRSEFMLNFKFSKDYTRYVDPEFITVQGALDNRYHQNEYYLSAVQQYGLKEWWDVSFATDFFVNDLNANIYRFPFPTRYTLQAALSTNISLKRFTLQASMLGCWVDEDVKYYQRGDNRRVYCPVVSASYQPFRSNQFRVRAFYKKSFRMPTFNDLYYTFIGNSSLRPEYTTQYDVGATWLKSFDSGILNRISIQSDAYYNRVKDKIVAMPSANLFRWTMMNLGEVEIKGLETNAALNFALPAEIELNAALNYTYQKAIDITPGGTVYGDQIPYTPVHSGTATAALLWRGWQLNYSYIYTGERYSQKENSRVNYVQPWYTSDFALLWQTNWKRTRIRASVEVNNAFNQYYDVVLNFPMPGRSYRFSLSVTI